MHLGQENNQQGEYIDRERIRAFAAVHIVYSHGILVIVLLFPM